MTAREAGRRRVDGRPRMGATGPQGVAFVELFFDLVFVFAITQLTAKTAHDLTAEGVLRSIVVGWLIWWAWTQFTWTLNPADTTHDWVRVITLAATAAAFVMAASVPRAFTDEALWFALPYLVVRLLGLGLQVRVEPGPGRISLREKSGGREWSQEPQIPANQYRCHYVRVRVRVHRYIDGSLAIFHGPRKLAYYDDRGNLEGVKKVA